MLMILSEWWRSLWGWLFEPRTFPVLPAPKRYRKPAARTTCPLCAREVAYSTTSNRTSKHRCLNGVVIQAHLERQT